MQTRHRSTFPAVELMFIRDGIPGSIQLDTGSNGAPFSGAAM